ITEGVDVRVNPLMTGSQGIASINLAGLLSGIHTIRVTFDGSSTQAPCESEVDIMIIPLVVLNIEPISEMYVGHYCAVNLSVSVLGIRSDWSGTLDAWLFDPVGQQVTEWTFEIGVYSVLTIGFNTQNVGTYTLNVTLRGLPILMSNDYPMAVVIIEELLDMELDVSTTPLLGGISILTIVGVILRRKMQGVMDSLPSEWTG
ncbi:MAG: hypothetical protein ACFFEL_13740, partial [Candidatus Thorarchaeota archaeon]